MIKNYRKLIAVLLIAILTFAQMPIFADAKPEFDKWALAELNEAEKYGIFPVEWYTQGFKKPLDGEKYQQLMTALATKLKETGIVAAAQSKPVATSKKGQPVTRQEVLNCIFSEIGRYDTNLLVKGQSVESILNGIGITKGKIDALSAKKACTVQEAVLLTSRAVQYVNEKYLSGGKGLM